MLYNRRGFLHQFLLGSPAEFIMKAACFLHFSWPILIRKIIFGVVLESLCRISSWWLAQRFWKPMQKWLRKLKLKLATLIWKVTDSQKIDFCVLSANFNFNFLSHFCIDFENLCAYQQEEILTIPKHPQKSSFWWVLAKKTAKNEVAQKLLF